MPMNRPQNGLNPGARPMSAQPSPPTRPGLNPQHMAAPQAAVAGGGERIRPYIAPPQPGNIVGGYADRSAAPPAMAGGGEGMRPYIAPPQPGNIVGGYADRSAAPPAMAGVGETPGRNTSI
jgi:hypothetical protein